MVKKKIVRKIGKKKYEKNWYKSLNEKKEEVPQATKSALEGEGGAWAVGR